MGNKKEKEINLFDMIWAVCQKWRSILLVGLVIALLAGGFSYYQSKKTAQNVAIAKPVTKESLLSGMSFEDRKSAEVYMSFKKIYDDLSYYCNHAPMMLLDPNAFYKGEVTFYVDNGYVIEEPVVESVNNIQAMVSMYRASVNDEACVQQAMKLFGDGCEASAAAEMIDCQNLYGSNAVVANDDSQGLFTISVYAADKETCEALKEIVKETVLGKTQSVRSELGNHKISIIQDTVAECADASLIVRQKDAADRTQSTASVMYNHANNFTDTQKAYVALRMKEANGETTSQPAAQPAAPAAQPKGTVDPQMVLIGFLGGLFLMFAIWALAYIFSNKIRLEDEFEASFDCKYIGNVPSSDEKKKKLLGFIDALFLKLRHFNKRYFAREEALDMAAANLRIAAAKADAKQIMITGALCGADEKKLAEELSERLKKDGVEVVFEKPVLYDAEALEKLVKIGHVVLAEKAEASLRMEIAKEIEICKQQEVNLMGCIVVY